MISLLRLERKQKNSSNPFRIRTFLFLSYSFEIETINMFIHSVVPWKTIPDSRPKWVRCIPVFRPKRRKTPPDHVCNSHDLSVLQSIEKEKEKFHPDHS